MVYIELPFGPPPILTESKTELRKFIIYPEKLPIYQLDVTQEYWEREKSLLPLLNINLFASYTLLKYKRDIYTGSIIDLQELCAIKVDKNVRNSMSFTRAPGPISESIKGNSSNILFWPGGFEVLEKTKDTENMKIDFVENLKISAKGFQSGIRFQTDNFTPKSLTKSVEIVTNSPKSNDSVVNVNNIIVKEKNFFHKKKGLNSSFKKPINTKFKKLSIENIDGVLEPLKSFNLPLFKITETPKNNLKTEWAEQIDVMTPVIDFEIKVPEPAIVFPYELDNFQKQAILKLEEKRDVFIAAHTSAGKTTIAEYAIAMSQKHMTRTIYTSPIKALSNQKYREFKEKFESVGLITGDLQINQTASCLIMTTEILQSMLYCAAEVIRDIEYVIFDEVHYINNEDRGHVWEEVIILLPHSINIVMLSATVPNPLEFAHWVGQIKKRKMYVISTIKRPVPLQHYLYTGFDKKSKDQMFLIVDKKGEFKRESLKEAEAAKKEASEKALKMQQTKYQHLKKKPVKEDFPKKIIIGANENVEDTINNVLMNQTEENVYDDRLRNDVLTNKERKMWIALLDYMQKEEKLPVVIFTLSRARCDKTAEAFSESLLTHKEKLFVKEFFKKSIRFLKGTDSQLPQVMRLQKLLELGIGVHHSGILPILKEIVEMLFQKGIVKVLFATETFAMGVNMPAKTVIFDSIRKFDGNSFRNLLPTEYIQMAGRAGRRGNDETGTVVVLCKQKVPNEKELRDMMLGVPQNLVSKFKVTYSMVLHLKRLSESLSVGDMMRRSFKEVNTLSSLEKNRKELVKIQKLIDKTPVPNESQRNLEKFYDLAKDYLQIWNTLRPSLLESKKAIKLLVEGRLLVITYLHHFCKLGVLLGFSKKSKEVLYKVLILTNSEQEKISQLNFKSEKWYKMLSLTKKDYSLLTNDFSHCVLTIPATSILEITSHLININCKMILADWDKRQIPRFKYSQPGPSCIEAVNELKNITLEAAKDKSVLLPYIEIKPNQFDLQRKELQMSEIYKTINEIKELQLDNFEQVFEETFKYKELQEMKMNLHKKLSDEYLENYPEYQSRIKVLKELKYIDEEDRVTMKGRVALEMGTYEIFLTELVLDNVLTNWQPDEISAMLSSLVFQHKDNDDTDEEVPRLNELKQKMMSIYERLVTLEKKYDLDPIVQPGFQLIRVVYEWARSKSFASIMKLTNIQEGIIVRCIQQLNETLQDVKNAAIIIGHPALKDKMEEASSKIKRDIVFTASLYTQD